MAHFIVVRKRGPAWQWSLPMRQQAEWESHAAFMDALTGERVIRAGGPLGDEDIAARVLLVVEASDATAVAARMLEDPWSPRGLLETVCIEPWTVLLGGLR